MGGNRDFGQVYKGKQVTTLKIEFDNEEALDHFVRWLCGQGEQNYWDWMECREDEEEGDITVLRFLYHEEDEKYSHDDRRRYGKWLKNNTLKTICGRMKKE